jgi:hypothetical protein
MPGSARSWQLRAPASTGRQGALEYRMCCAVPARLGVRGRPARCAGSRAGEIMMAAAFRRVVCRLRSPRQAVPLPRSAGGPTQVCSPARGQPRAPAGHWRGAGWPGPAGRAPCAGSAARGLGRPGAAPRPVGGPGRPGPRCALVLAPAPVQFLRCVAPTVPLTAPGEGERAGGRRTNALSSCGRDVDGAGPDRLVVASTGPT